MMRCRRLLLVTMSAALMTAVPTATPAAQACTGEVCDAICYAYWSLGKPCPIR